MSPSGDVYQCAHQYFFSWKTGDWDRLRAALAPEVRFEAPGERVLEGADALVAWYREHARFPRLDNVTLRTLVSGEDEAIVAFDVFFDDRHATVFDLLRVRAGRIVHVLTAAAYWK